MMTSSCKQEHFYKTGARKLILVLKDATRIGISYSTATAKGTIQEDGSYAKKLKVGETLSPVFKDLFCGDVVFTVIFYM